MKAASSIADFARNWRLVYSGSLADNRSIRGRDGEYRVQVKAPLRVTDEGVVIDLADELWTLEWPYANQLLPPGGLKGQPLVKLSDEDFDVAWRPGLTTSFTALADIRYDTSANQLQKRTITVTIADGFVTNVTSPSAWTLISGGQAQPCPDD